MSKEDLKPKQQYNIKSIEERWTKGKSYGKMKMLLGPLMMDGNLSMIFGRFGVGKSALAFQIAFAVAKGERLFGMLPNECGPKRVLYFDGELEDNQIYDRLRKDGKFPKNIDFIFEDLEFSPDPKDKIDTILDMVEKEVRTKKYQFIIIDNLHTLGERLEESTSARMIMKQLKKIMVEASKVVKYPYTDQSLFEFWKNDNQDEPSIGNLGGGSDHIAFYMHVGVPSLSGGAGGPNLYHSNYDSFRFYEQYVDPEFQMGPMVEHMAGLMALRMANAELIPYNLNRYAQDLKIHFGNAESKINGYDQEFKGFKLTADAIRSLEQISQDLTLEIKSNLEDVNPYPNSNEVISSFCKSSLISFP